jgi:hypothetical protein
MSDLTFAEKMKLEKLFQMGSGYVLDFSNRTFQEFVFDSIGKDVYDANNTYGGGSKASLLRAFWKQEPNYRAGKLISDLLEHCRDWRARDGVELYKECLRIAERLKQSAPVQDLEAITPNSADREFEVLAKSVKDAIDKNEPEIGLDRLHTFVIKYMRVLCEKYNIAVGRDKPLHSLVGEYVKHLKHRGLIESPMTERILKSSISTLESFNDVRNDQSYAHDNPVLNYSESLLIFNHVASAIRFMTELEARGARPNAAQEVEEISPDDIPF